MLRNWSQDMTDQFRKKVFPFDHGLNDTGLFSDEALIALLKKHPAHLTDVCTMGTTDDPKFPNKLRTGDFRDCTAEEIYESAKSGKIWINLRRAMNVHPEYKRELDKMYGGIADKTGQKPFNANGGILLTSPVARTPYHFDKTETILWHIRGSKRIFFYPVEPKYIPDAYYERALTNMLEEDLPYEDGFDANAEIYDLEEGQAISWPLSSPHRVENSTFCVSVTTEFSSRESGMKNAAMLANATLRHKLGLNPHYTGASKVSLLAKSMLGMALRKTKLASNTIKPDYVTFKVDPHVSDKIVDVEPYVRDF